jgi:hypothetical protein
MLQASARSWRPGRLSSLLVGLFVLGGAATALALLNSAKADPPKAAAKEAKHQEEVKWPTPLTLVIAPRSEKEDPAELSQVNEMIKTINTRCEEKWKENKVVPSRYADDFEYIRRVMLDVIGRIAKPEEIREYLSWPKEKRRSMLVNRLLYGDLSEEYARHWANIWCNWLLTRSGSFGRGPYHEEMTVWLEDQFAQNKKFHEIVKDLLTARGENTTNGAVNFILAHVGENVPPARRTEEGQFEMVPITSRITRLFLGTQVQCSQCHDHPFYSNIKQEHFWGVNAFLRQVERVGQPPMPGTRMMTYNKLELKDNPNAASDAIVFFEKRNGVILTAKPEFLPVGEAKHGAAMPPGTTGVARREALANFLIDHEMFPKAIVNRMWAVFFGRGFVNPPDDFNDQNQPSNPELLNELADRFKHYDYDLKKLIRWICGSNPYSLSYVANKTNDKQEHEALFSRMIMKSMSPEQLFESLMVASKAEAAESKDGKKALKEQWLGNLISNFGDDEGNEVNFNGTVVQALLMMNGKDINDAISRKEKGAVAIAIRNRSEKAAIEELYLTALNRPPTAREAKTILDQFRLRPQFAAKDYQNPNARYEDLFWALLNSNEFLLNH